MKDLTTKNEQNIEVSSLRAIKAYLISLAVLNDEVHDAQNTIALEAAKREFHRSMDSLTRGEIFTSHIDQG